jgi:acyl-CoA synthetase (AMP-forming)/AMP-acid ligase II
VVGVPRPVIGEIGLAFIVPAPGASAPTLAELRRWVTGRLADYKAPDELRVVAALPLTPMMKVDKAALRCRDNV